MKLLLDSHAYLWWLADHPSLSDAARAAVADPGNVVYVSAATIWEIEIKRSLGRLDAGTADLVAEIEANRFAELPVGAAHAAAAARLPAHHGDPFDRMLIAQSQVDGLVCVTRDPAFDAYGVPVLW
ncbi:MAG TPA: type II toxin-antitoxin system VapC family toxin [Longimicrobiales bacterium]|nr:type II toxin-antitoxin system VapC family toxin [Longimicrobiales bacterium]